MKINRINCRNRKGVPKFRGIQPQKGQSLVELALTLTLLITLLAGAFDLGSAFFDYIALRDAAQEGAIYGSIYRDFPTDSKSTFPIVTRVKGSSNTPVDFSTFIESCSPTSPSGICITFSDPEQCTSDTITVTVRFTYSITMPLIGGLIGSQSIPLHATVTNVILTPQCITP
jgi:hypothetical protein